MSVRPLEAAPASVPRRVLVVDDHEAMGTSLKLLLRDEHQVDVVTSAAEALIRLGAAAYDVVLCDLLMPGITGIELFEQVRRSDPALARRFVFMTGGGTSVATQQFLEQTPQPVLEKPFAPAALRAAIAAGAGR